MQSSPYWKKAFDYDCARYEFLHFAERATDIIEAEIHHIPRAEALIRLHGFITFPRDGLAVQVGFGARPTNRDRVPNKNDPSLHAHENGSSLIYSLGPTGATAVLLFPAKSQVMEPRERFIVRRIRNMSSYQLRSALKNDLKDLVAYNYATSLDGSPNLREWLRMRWIALVCRKDIEGKQEIRGAQLLYQGTGFIARVGLVSLIKPFAIILAILALSYFGLYALAKIITPH